MLQRQSLHPNQIYLCYNAVSVFLFVGQQADPSLLHQLFAVHSPQQIDFNRGEDSIFSEEA